MKQQSTVTPSVASKKSHAEAGLTWWQSHATVACTGKISASQVQNVPKYNRKLGETFPFQMNNNPHQQCSARI